MRHLLIFTLLLLTSCGFHLRGSVALPPALSEVAVKDVSLNSDIAPELRRALKNAGVRVSDSAAMVLMVRAEKYAKRVLSVDSVGRALEYGLSYSVRFSLKDEKGIAWISEESVIQTRDLRFDATAVLGTAREEAQLKTEMRRDAVSQILRQLQYAKEPVDLPAKALAKPLEKEVKQPAKKSAEKPGSK
ncbi:MAG: LPS assembly lipoprotein LptE [Gammaproteobacteria bacterium]